MLSAFGGAPGARAFSPEPPWPYLVANALIIKPAVAPTVKVARSLLSSVPLFLEEVQMKEWS